MTHLTNLGLWIVGHPLQLLAILVAIWAVSHVIGAAVYAVACAREAQAEQRQRQVLEAAINLSSAPRAPGLTSERRRVS